MSVNPSAPPNPSGLIENIDKIDRRKFLSLAAMATGAALLPNPAAKASSPQAAPGDFDFIFLTDTHIQPELAADKGCAMAFKKVRSLSADFVIQGGDHIFDGLAVDRQRVDSLVQLYAHTEQAVEKPVHHTIGNHDLIGVLPASGQSPHSPGYGKKLFNELHGPTYYSFDHKGYHFIVLDTVQPTPDRAWEAKIDDPQFEWLAADLAKLAPGAPVIVSAHVPLVSAAQEYAAPTAKSGSGVAVTSAIVHPQLTVGNAWQVLPLLEKHNVLAVFQGHTHINEVVQFRGIHYVTSGAVSGNWWHGTRWGIPEGFTVVSLRNGKIDWRYETYGFQSIDPQNS
jgi:3',5'-cyclic AMP phosphodiesterase CpdA